MVTILTPAQQRELSTFIAEARKRNPQGDYVMEGTHTWRGYRRGRQGVREAGAPDTFSNQLNQAAGQNNLDDTDENGFEAFLSQMIALIARDAAATGKVNPAYINLMADLAASQRLGAGGVQRSSFVSPAAGSTPIGRTEAAPRARLAETLTFAATALPGQRAPVQPAAPPVKAKAFDQMTPQELQDEHIARLNLLARERALLSPFYTRTAA